MRWSRFLLRRVVWSLTSRSHFKRRLSLTPEDIVHLRKRCLVRKAADNRDQTIVSEVQARCCKTRNCDRNGLLSKCPDVGSVLLRRSAPENAAHGRHMSERSADRRFESSVGHLEADEFAAFAV